MLQKSKYAVDKYSEGEIKERILLAVNSAKIYNCYQIGNNKAVGIVWEGNTILENICAYNLQSFPYGNYVGQITNKNIFYKNDEDFIQLNKWKYNEGDYPSFE